MGRREDRSSSSEESNAGLFNATKMNERIEMQIGSLMGKKEYEEVQMTFRSEKSCGIRPLARKYWKMAVSAATSEVCVLNSDGCWSTIHKICKQDTRELA